jgi:hypothetical protein
VQNRATGSLGCSDLCIRHNTVTSAKVDGTGSNLIDTGAGTDGLIVNIYTGEFTVFAKPFGV